MLASEPILNVQQQLFVRPLSLWQPTVKEQEGRAIRPFVAGHRVLSSGPAIVYFAHGQYFPLPAEDIESVVAFARHRQVPFLVLQSARDSTDRPAMRPLMHGIGGYPVTLLLHQGEVWLYVIDGVNVGEDERF